MKTWSADRVQTQAIQMECKVRLSYWNLSTNY